MQFPPSFISESEDIHVIIETPKGCGNKYSFDPELQLFTLTKILPHGIVFPHHFGFIPHTKGEDGDPLDVLVLMDEPSYPGCLVKCKVLGVVQAEEKNGGPAIRNDRLIAAALESHHYKKLSNLRHMDKYEQNEIVNFLYAYTNLSKKDFKHLKNKGRKTAIELIKKQVYGNN
jgi:inorganic pyrophosphatase